MDSTVETLRKDRYIACPLCKRLGAGWSWEDSLNGHALCNFCVDRLGLTEIFYEILDALEEADADTGEA